MSLRPAIRPALGRSPHRLGRDVRFGSVGIAVQFVAWAAPMSVPWVIYDNASSPVDILLALTVPLIGPAVATPLLTRVQRQRFAALLGVGITGPPRARRQLWYHLLAGPAVAFGGVLAWGFALVGVVAATVFLWRQQAGRLKFLPDATSAAYLTVGGCALLALAYWLIGALVRLDTRAATAFLGPGPAAELERRVEDLTESRAGAVDAADAERRRIERDLHDGAQQRLVSMAVNLGLAKATMDDLPEAARKVIDEAHREAKEAIEELSNLVRGLHPAVLDELGLDAALSGIAARAPLPVRLRVDVPERAAPTVEAVAYFVVSEALANVAKHARATRAGVEVVRAGDRLRVVVDDDGAGGADPARGSGLAGLAQRVGSVDGTFDISSPLGGPTVITVELPCAL
ncbi:sensor histidine kinase [Streptomyces malaysiensis subsp. malaysiensis]|uniref:sensor histidine kinase n=1 Tax=Streptomyces malaysiensis TaxID=92644 RepID=UPI000BFDEDAE|nr:sensor histidine kinase [Streptomyces malaysiensis]ATL82746.1 two-component system sensor kinase [Streptomyces malaysiensis]QDL73011.1 sensor histidine kinase [Streptomyces malaysiensis]